MNPSIPPLPAQRKVFGLNTDLWRVAITVGIAQFSISLWYWEFSIFLESIIAPWQMGVVLGSGTLITLIGYQTAGILSDMIGRKKTFVASFIPVGLGLILISLFPAWPLVLVEFPIIMFGWSMILVVSRAIPADAIASEMGKDSARTFTMILLPAFLMDGLSVILASFLLNAGLTSNHLHFIAGCSTILGMTIAQVFVRESLASETTRKAREGPIISFRNLGRNFWLITMGMILIYFFHTSATSYLGNLAVGEWGIERASYGYVYSIFSLTGTIVMYSISSLTDRNVKAGLIAGIVLNFVIILMFSQLNGFFVFMLLNAFWSFSTMAWIGTERTLVVSQAKDTSRGRALGTYQFIVGATGVVSVNFGAFLWTTYGNLRFVFMISGIVGIGLAVLVAIILRSVHIPEKKENLEIDEQL